MRLPFHVDFGRAVFAVALAVLLYFVALNETNPESRNLTPFTVAVQPVNVPAGLVVTTAPSPIHLWVRAPSNVFSRLRADSFTAQVDASSTVAGDNDNLPVLVNSTDPDVHQADPEPGTVRLHLEEIRTQTLPVRVNLTGQVPQQYLLGQATVDPPQMTITGAASLVGQATEAVVDVSVAGITVPINGVYTPRILDSRGNDLKDLNLRTAPPSVTVPVRVTTLAVNQTVRVPPSVINLSGSIQLPHALDLVSVTISGPAPALSSLALSPNDFKIVLDASGKGPGRSTLDVKVIQVPTGMTLQDFSPRQVQVDLTQAPTPTPVPSPSPPPPAG